MALVRALSAANSLPGPMAPAEWAFHPLLAPGARSAALYPYSPKTPAPLAAGASRGLEAAAIRGRPGCAARAPAGYTALLRRSRYS
jgi:hypothetical protein